MNRQTYIAKNNEVPQAWHLVDATDKILGRMATEIAMILMGKTKPEYTPHHDVGDFVVILNAEKIRLSGKKLDQKFYETFSGHPSGRKLKSYRDMIEDKPAFLVSEAVRRMLPKNRLGTVMLSKLKVYAGNEHPHSAQNPTPLTLKKA